jgi:hypothetical protein
MNRPSVKHVGISSPLPPRQRRLSSPGGQHGTKGNMKPLDRARFVANGSAGSKTGGLCGLRVTILVNGMRGRVFLSLADLVG